MAAGLFSKVGYGQVEPNHLSAQRNGRIWAQLPVEDSVEILEQGMFVQYDRALGKCTTNVNSPVEWSLVFNEVHNYEQDRQGTKDFALKKTELLGTNGPTAWRDGNSYNKSGAITPRVFGLENTDTWTTNLVYLNNSQNLPNAGDTLGLKVLTINSAENASNNYSVAVLAEASDADVLYPAFRVVKKTTLADGQTAIKVQKIGGTVNVNTTTNTVQL